MMMYRLLLLLGGLTFLASWTLAQEALYKGEQGVVQFTSEAPLELIKAESKSLRGVIEPATKAFAFSLRIKSFEGFNSDIQQTHFFENYLEEKKYPLATFSGKLIEDIPFDSIGTYTIRAKGNLEIHGVVKERIIRGTLTIRNGSARVQASFLVPVADHGINIPRIVRQKVAEQIAITMDMEMNGGYKL